MTWTKTSVILSAVMSVTVGCAVKKAATQPAERAMAATAPSTQPTTMPAPASASTEIPEVARERFRLVYEKDEVVSVLDNGAVVIAKRVVGSPVLAVRGYVRTGGIYEGPYLGGGLSHLLEHLVAGGSNSRHTEAQSRELLQQIGNNSNAFTSTDHTAYFVNTTPGNLDKAADLVTGWMLHALITPEEFNREREVVQRELEMGTGEPDRQFYYVNQMNRYKVSPAGVPVIGYQSVIKQLSRDDVYCYYKQAYQPNNMVFSIAGDLPPETMLKAMQRCIDVPAGRVFDHTLPAEPEVLTPRTLVTSMPKIGEARVAVEFPSVRLDDPDLYALDLLAAVLGQGEGSVLVREVRDKQLVSAISSYNATPAYEKGSFAVSFQCKPEKLDAAVDAIQVVLDRAKREPLDQGAVDRAKVQMRVDRLRELQETQNVAGSMASDYLSTADVHFGERYLEHIAAVTPADLQAVARKYFDNHRLIKTVMLPSDDPEAAGLASAEELLRSAAKPVTTTAAAATTQEAYAVHKSILDDGTILLVRRVPSSPLIAVRMYAEGGLTAETEANNGIGNLTMRMLMRGTSFRSARQLAEQLDAIGASVETSAGNNTWYWNASMLKDDFAKGMELYADVVNNPTFPPAEVETMRKRILASIAQEDAAWSAQAMRYFRKQYFPATSPYHMLSIGSAGTVAKLTAEDLKTWYQNSIRKSRRVLAIYGDIDPEVARATAQKLLGTGPKIEQQPAPREFAKGVEIVDTRPQATVLRVDVQKTHQPLAGIIIGYEANPTIGDPATDTLNLADTMASGWGYPTGYLHETLRGEGLVYVVAAQNWLGRRIQTPGTLFVYAGCEPSKVNEVVDKILLNIARLQGTPEDIQPTWFGRAKELLLTDEAMSKETVAEQATSASLDELWGLGYDYSESLAKRISVITLPEIQKIARERLRRCVVTISTPAPEVVKVETGIRLYDKFPAVELTPKGIQHDSPGAAR